MVTEARTHSPSERDIVVRQVDALVIDDDPDALLLIEAIVSNAGYSIMTARDGREAIDLLRAVRPSVIFVDLCMPGMDGAEFRQAMRRNREWISIPTVVMTGTNDEPLLDPAVEETLHKPVRGKAIIEIVRRHAGRGCQH